MSDEVVSFSLTCVGVVCNKGLPSVFRPRRKVDGSPCQAGHQEGTTNEYAPQMRRGSAGDQHHAC